MLIRLVVFRFGWKLNDAIRSTIMRQHLINVQEPAVKQMQNWKPTHLGTTVSTPKTIELPQVNSSWGSPSQLCKGGQIVLQSTVVDTSRLATSTRPVLHMPSLLQPAMVAGLHPCIGQIGLEDIQTQKLLLHGRTTLSVSVLESRPRAPRKVQ